MLLDNMKVLLSQYVILPLIVKLEIDCLLFTSKTSLSESLFVFGEKVRNFFTSFFIFVPTRLLLSADNVKADLEIIRVLELLLLLGTRYYQSVYLKIDNPRPFSSFSNNL